MLENGGKSKSYNNNESTVNPKYEKDNHLPYTPLLLTKLMEGINKGLALGLCS